MSWGHEWRTLDVAETYEREELVLESLHEPSKKVAITLRQCANCGILRIDPDLEGDDGFVIVYADHGKVLEIEPECSDAREAERKAIVAYGRMRSDNICSDDIGLDIVLDEIERGDDRQA